VATFQAGVQAATDVNPLDATGTVSWLAGDAGVVWIKNEGGDRTVTSFQKSTGSPANAFTFPAVSGQTKLVHSNTDLVGHFGYLLNASTDASCTMRLTLNTAASFVKFLMIQFRPAAGETFAFDVAKIGEAVSGTSISSGNVTTTGDTVSVGSFGEYTGTTTSSEQINGVAATEPMTPLADGTVWYRIITGTFTGAATATIGSSSEWLCGVLSLKIIRSAIAATFDPKPVRGPRVLGEPFGVVPVLLGQGILVSSTVAANPLTVAATQDGLTGAATMTVANPITATVAGSQSGLTGAATVTETIPSTVAGVQPGLTGAATVTIANPITLAADGVLPSLVGAASVSEAIPSTVAATQDGLTGAATVSVAGPITSTVAGEQDGLTAAASVDISLLGTTMTVAGVQPGLTGEAAMVETLPATVAATQDGLTAAATMTETIPATVAGVQPGLVVAASVNTAFEPVTATVAATQAGLTGAATMSEALGMSVAATQDALVGAGSVSSAAPITLAINATQPGLVGNASVSSDVAGGGGGATSRGRRRSRFKPGWA